jgi:hypothetical protein
LGRFRTFFLGVSRYRTLLHPLTHSTRTFFFFGLSEPERPCTKPRVSSSAFAIARNAHKAPAFRSIFFFFWFCLANQIGRWNSTNGFAAFHTHYPLLPSPCDLYTSSVGAPEFWRHYFELLGRVVGRCLGDAELLKFLGKIISIFPRQLLAWLIHRHIPVLF